ncbi:MAG TPA: hypothetical protein VFS17_04190, partial [Methylophilaceae bacterium]|nr:hypothetical protein [Methylophilaceae bacterium]
VAKAEPVSVKKEVAKTEPRKRKVTSSKKKETETAPEPAPVSSPSTTVAANPPPHHETAVKESHEAASEDKQKSGWSAFTESIKKGREEHVCTQAEIALNQCK